MKKTYALIIALLLGLCQAFADDYMPGTNLQPVVQDIIRSYIPWQSAEFNGKLKSDKLPLSPTVKIYMEHDSLIQMSLRAPILGEVGRLELTTSRITVVNRMKRTYFSESTDNLMEMYPGLIGDIQSILLARVTILGDGQLDNDNAALVEVSQDGNGNWILVPQSDGLAGLRYGFVVGGNSRTLALDAIINGFFELEVLYTYANKSMKMDVNVDAKSKKFDATLDFSSVKWGGSKMSDVKLDNYTRTDIKGFLGSLK